MIDCHAHLAEPIFAEDLEEVLARASAAGVRRIVCVSEDLDDASRVLQIARRHEIIEAGIGLYPARADVERAEAMCRMVRDNAGDLVCIGEIGLDYWLAKKDHEREVQREVLDRFVALADELGLALNVHSRSAGRHTVNFLRERGAQRVLMHAFDGKASYALAGVEAGFKFSIPPSVVRSPQKQKLVRRLPLSALLLETDSPVLGPDRESRNEPRNAEVSAKAIAEIKECSLGEVLEVTTQNAQELFGFGR